MTRPNKPLERSGTDAAAQVAATSAGRSAPIRSTHQRCLKSLGANEALQIETPLPPREAAVQLGGSPNTWF